MLLIVFHTVAGCIYKYMYMVTGIVVSYTQCAHACVYIFFLVLNKKHMKLAMWNCNQCIDMNSTSVVSLNIKKKN